MFPWCIQHGTLCLPGKNWWSSSWFLCPFPLCTVKNPWGPDTITTHICGPQHCSVWSFWDALPNMVWMVISCVTMTGTLGTWRIGQVFWVFLWWCCGYISCCCSWTRESKCLLSCGGLFNPLPSWIAPKAWPFSGYKGTSAACLSQNWDNSFAPSCDFEQKTSGAHVSQRSGDLLTIIPRRGHSL